MMAYPAKQWKVGPTKFSREGMYPVVSTYRADGMIAIQLIGSDGAPSLTATVCMVDYTTFRSRRHVWIKTWSENEGVVEALEKAGIIALTGTTHPAGFATAVEAVLTDEFIASLPQEFQDYILVSVDTKI